MILLAMLGGMSSGDGIGAMTILTPLLASAGVMVYIITMLLGAVGIVWVADHIESSYLLGAFMAGMLATIWPHFQDTWDELCEPVLPWLCRCFFACTVGFAVPAAALASGGPGLIIATIVIAIISKFITGFLATGCRDPKFMAYTFQVGTAMVGRGELGFVQIQTCLSQGILGPKGAQATNAAFGAIVWALLIASLVGPILFRLTLKMKPKEHLLVRSHSSWLTILENSSPLMLRADCHDSSITELPMMLPLTQRRRRFRMFPQLRIFRLSSSPCLFQKQLLYR